MANTVNDIQTKVAIDRWSKRIPMGKPAHRITDPMIT